MDTILPAETLLEPPADPLEPGSLSERAYASLLDLLLSGELAPGAVLQERRLAEMLSISRTPVREALGRLEAEHLVTRQAGRRLIVAEIGVEAYVNLLDIRKILEMEVAARATGRVTAEKADEVTREIEALIAQPEVSPAEHWAVDELVHGTIADAAGNPMLAATLRDLRRRTHIFNTARIAYRRQPGGSEHLALIAAATGDDPALTRRLMGQHLDNVRDAIIDFILGRRS